MSQIIVTGSSAGLGLAIAKFLLADKRKHRLLLCAGSNDSPLKELQSSAENVGRVSIFKGSMSEPGAAKKVVEKFKDAYGDRLDALVINHGTLGECSRIAFIDEAEWEDVFRVNVSSYVGLVQSAIPYLRESSGRIIFTSSGAAENAYTSWGAYGASKAAINHLAKTLAKEEKGIITVSIRPGMVDTKMQEDIRGKYLSKMDEDDQAKFVSAHKDGKLLQPELPGHVIAKLATDATEDLSGLFLSWNDNKLSSYQAES